MVLGAVLAPGCSSSSTTTDSGQPSASAGRTAANGGTTHVAGFGGSSSGGASGDTAAGSPSLGGSSSSAGDSSVGGTAVQGETGGAAPGIAGAPSAGSAGNLGSAGARFCGTTAATGSTPLAFPGAQGFGKNATGARAGKVFHVTNLNDSGAGSFRDAVSASGRFVVFDVGGYIGLKTAVSVNSNITIAGQTAPGQGIGFKGGEISFADRTNIIMRHVRIRPGADTESDTDDALSLYQASNVMIDHSSFEFAPWNNIDGVSSDWQTHPATNITFQDSLIADPTGQQFGAHTESVASDWAWYRNIFANSHNRNPLAKVNTVFVNNLEYNNEACYTTHTSTEFKHDIVNNYFVYGPSTSGNTWFQIDKNQSIYYAGNLQDSDKNGALGGSTTTPSWYQGTGTILTSPWSPETTAIAPLSPVSAARVAMSRAGTLPRDPLDALIIGQVMTLGKGASGTRAGSAGSMYESQTSTGLDNDGYGTITSGTKPADSDNDGMADSWEKAAGTNPSTDDALSKASDGYTNLEHYVNWLAEPHASTPFGQAVDIDLAGYSSGFSTVSPTFMVSEAQNGTVSLGTDGHTAHFQPGAGCYGFGSFSFGVKGSDGAEDSDVVVVLITR
ncbi:MAG TPA: hypothetical protein VER96_29485 [Polyangiaceae bacterium]|nr:hypothetical protein [Polyangiaceae bacterium]